MSDEGFMPGATTVGLVCKDGAILASERRYSYGTFVMSKVAKKVFKITDNIGVGCAGIIGDMQVLAREANAYMSIFRYERGRSGTVKNTAKLFASLLSSRRLFPYLAQTIIAGIDDGNPELFVLDPKARFWGTSSQRLVRAQKSRWESLSRNIARVCPLKKQSL